jgi:hypothetical protein
VTLHLLRLGRLGRPIALLGLTALLLAAEVAPRIARADGGLFLAENARAASMAGAMVARPGDPSAITMNPAGLGDVEAPRLLLMGHLGQHRLSFARTGEAAQVTNTQLGGYGLSLVAPLPGPEIFQRLVIGGSAQLPGAHIIQVTAPSRRDRPLSPYYGDRLQATSVSLSLGLRLPLGLRLGGGVRFAPLLLAPTMVDFDARRGETVDEGVAISQDRTLTLVPTAVVGARYQPIPEVAVGVAWRQGLSVEAAGDFDIRAGAVRVADDYRFRIRLAPEELAFGLALFPGSEGSSGSSGSGAWSLSADFIWARWSGTTTTHAEVAEPGFRDVLDVRAGAEWRALPGLSLRAGYGFLPSPLSPQRGVDNLLDADRHELALGVGLSLSAFGLLPLRIDFALRAHLLHRQQASKDPARLPDADPELDGVQIDNLGYPGFTSEGSVIQASLALSMPLDVHPGADASEENSTPDSGNEETSPGSPEGEENSAEEVEP